MTPTASNAIEALLFFIFFIIIPLHQITTVIGSFGVVNCIPVWHGKIDQGGTFHNNNRISNIY